MKEPVKIIFDTDIGGDCDDAGALAMLHRLCDRGEAELLAVTHCYATPWVAGCIDAINHFYNRTVPIGVNYRNANTTNRGVYAAALSEGYPNDYLAEDFTTDRRPPDTLTVLRETLSRAEDHSVTFAVTGNLDSMARLICSEPDDISPMSGVELVERKIARTVVMGGRFFESWPMVIYPDGNASGNPVAWEWNIHATPMESLRSVCRLWRGELVYSSYEIGSYIKTMVGYPSRAQKDDPVAYAYELHNQGNGRSSWDHTAILEAVRPGMYWNYHAFGHIEVDENYVTRWSPSEEYRHTYLLPRVNYEEIRVVIDDLVDGK